MKIIAFILALVASVAMAGSLGRPKNNHRELNMNHYGNSYLPWGTGFWDTCGYTTAVLKPTKGRHAHFDYHCDIPIGWYGHNEIVSFQITTSKGWDMHHNHVDCWFGRGAHHEPMIHCDTNVFEGQAMIHLLCCSCDEYHYYSMDMQLRNETSEDTLRDPFN